MAFFMFAKVGKGHHCSNDEICSKRKAVVVAVLLYKTNRLHVAMHLFSNRSQRTSKCGKNISDTLGYCLAHHIFVLTTF